MGKGIPIIDMATDGANTELGGFLLCSINCGFACDRKKNKPAMTTPVTVICISPCFKPFKYKNDIIYAETKQFKANIL